MTRKIKILAKYIWLPYFGGTFFCLLSPDFPDSNQQICNHMVSILNPKTTRTPHKTVVVMDYEVPNLMFSLLYFPAKALETPYRTITSVNPSRPTFMYLKTQNTTFQHTINDNSLVKRLFFICSLLPVSNRLPQMNKHSIRNDTLVRYVTSYKACLTT